MTPLLPSASLPASRLLVLCFFNSVLISLSPTLSLSHDPSRSTQFPFPPPSIRNNDAAMSPAISTQDSPKTRPQHMPDGCALYTNTAATTSTRRLKMPSHLTHYHRRRDACKFYQIHAEHLLPPLKALQPPSNDPNDPENHQQQAQSLSERPARAIKPPRSTLRAHTPPIRAPTTAARLQSSAHIVRRAQLEWLGKQRTRSVNLNYLFVPNLTWPNQNDCAQGFIAPCESTKSTHNG
ncbi:hypothetical protein Hypma_013306 [Hypsizygus marmoreus]|uniref:Uncharacterized protein n=1 Tax=Hypsizygus marmoreus TaxID=39966 RepID=A0A369JLE6_HYPMA|nr:hypothetical protein Hypma_013306 [Hypsizygus marmoreus]